MSKRVTIQRSCVRCDAGFRSDRGAPKLCPPCRETHGWCVTGQHFEPLARMVDRSRCRPCAVVVVRVQQDRKVRWLNELKLHSGCVDCGYAAHPEALDFDHLPGFDKGFNIGMGLRSRSWAALEAEVLKCEVRCANCHRVKTAQRREGNT